MAAESTTVQLPMDRTEPLTALLSELKDRSRDGMVRLRFCDAYFAILMYMDKYHMTDAIQQYDTGSDHPASTSTISLLCMLHAVTKNASDQADYLIRLWLNTLESIVQTEVYEERSYHSLLDKFWRVFVPLPTQEVIKNVIPYYTSSSLSQILENQTSYYEIQRMVSVHYFELEFGFHTGYINALTLGLFCFLRITNGHPKQRQMVLDYLLQETEINVMGLPYYDEPETVRKEFVVRGGF